VRKSLYNRSPDYVALQISIGGPAGGTVQLINDRYGRVYFAPGGTIGKSETVLAGMCVAGWLHQSAKPTPERLYTYIRQFSLGTGVGYLIGVNHVWGMPGLGNEVGLASRQIGLTGTWAWKTALDGYRW
jgi:hypothetical protein